MAHSSLPEAMRKYLDRLSPIIHTTFPSRLTNGIRYHTHQSILLPLSNLYSVFGNANVKKWGGGHCNGAHKHHEAAHSLSQMRFKASQPTKKLRAETCAERYASSLARLNHSCVQDALLDIGNNLCTRVYTKVSGLSR
jgi:hypothetical protein